MLRLTDIKLPPLDHEELALEQAILEKLKIKKRATVVLYYV